MESPLHDTFKCDKGEMYSALNLNGLIQNIPIKYSNLNGLYIVVDTSNHLDNFISRNDFIDNGMDSNFNQLLGMLGGNLFSGKTKAIKHHYLNMHIQYRQDQRPQIVWMINGSNDTFAFHISDNMTVALLQGKTKNNNWHPVQYYDISNCGNSSSLLYLPPNKAIPVLIFLPKLGNFSTKLRLKLHGVDKFYYSNAFDWTIDECAFVEDRSTYRSYNGKDSFPNNKLDSLCLY